MSHEPGRPVAPGERTPPTQASRRLERAPGERYRAPGRSGARTSASPHEVRGTAWGLLAAAAVALAWGILAGVFDFGLGLLLVAGIGGWAIGWAVAWGAWRGAEHEVASAPGVIAGGLGFLAGVASIVLDYLLALALLPQSSQSFVERLGSTPFGDWLGPQLGSEQVIEIIVGPLLAALVAWRTAARA